MKYFQGRHKTERIYNRSFLDVYIRTVELADIISTRMQLIMNLSRLVRVGSAGSANTASVSSGLARTEAVGSAVVGEGVSSTRARCEEWRGSSSRQVVTERVDTSIFTIVILLVMSLDCHHRIEMKDLLTYTAGVEVEQVLVASSDSSVAESAAVTDNSNREAITVPILALPNPNSWSSYKERHLHIADINIGHSHSSSVGYDEVRLNQTVVTGDSPKGIVDSHVSNPVGGNSNRSCLTVGHGTGASGSRDRSRSTWVGVKGGGDGVTVAVDNNNGHVLRWACIVKSSSNGVHCHSTIDCETVSRQSGGCRSRVWQGIAGSSQGQQRDGRECVHFV